MSFVKKGNHSFNSKEEIVMSNLVCLGPDKEITLSLDMHNCNHLSLCSIINEFFQERYKPQFGTQIVMIAPRPNKHYMIRPVFDLEVNIDELIQIASDKLGIPKQYICIEE